MPDAPKDANEKQATELVLSAEELEKQQQMPSVVQVEDKAEVCTPAKETAKNRTTETASTSKPQATTQAEKPVKVAATGGTGTAASSNRDVRISGVSFASRGLLILF